MQRQQINSDAESNISSNLNKQHSRSVRKLYNRIGNNIRVLNKSRVSNRSNNSIGSVALRRTELSNDKIYSREEDFLVNDSREVDFESDINNIKGSINSNTKNEQSSSSNKYRQRIKLSKQSFSRRSSSQKSYRQNQGIVKKPTKHQIEKLFMMEDQIINNAGYTKQFNPKRDIYGSKQSQQKNRRVQESNNYRKNYKQSARSSRQRQDQSISNVRSYKLMKSSLKSNIKSSKHLPRQSKEINRNYYHQQSQASVNDSQMEKFSRKYNHSKNKNQQYKMNVNVKDERKYRENFQEDNNYQLKKHVDIRPSQYQIQRNKKQLKNDYYYVQKQKSSRQIKDKQYKDYKNKQKMQTIQKESSRQRQKQTQYHKLHRYKSQKYMSTNDSQIMSTKRYQKDRNYNDSQKRQKYSNKNKQYSKRHYPYPQRQLQLQPQNSLQKYQHEQWTREQNRRHAKENHKHISEKLLLMEQQSVFKDRKQNKYNRQKYKHHNDRQRSSILLLRSKNNESQLRKDIRIKQKEYAYLYGLKQSDLQDESRIRRSSKKLSYKINSQSSRIQSPMSPRTPKPYQQNQYYAHMMTPGSAASTKNYLSAKHSPTTQISSTLDSLLLSINSHISLSQDERSSTSALIDKLNLHIKTLQIISDYSKEFKKMYEDIEQWQELIFLSYKKYWVERVKVIEYLKKFIVPLKRHSSQKINLKAQSSNKNGKYQPLSSPIMEDPFSSNTLLQNPFIIPFCKLSEEQLNKLGRSSGIQNSISRLEKETSQVYSHLQELYNQFITKCHNVNMNMLYCDNFSDEIYLQMLTEIQKLLPNLEQFKMFEVTKIRLGKIVKAGILILHMNGKHVRNISQILMFDDCEKIGQKKKIKAFTAYDLYYEVFQKLVVE